MSKKTLLREFTTEIEKLKSELIATRHRNGVYMTTDAYEEMTVESESRRIVNEEQRAKIETMEANLRNKVQELFTLTSNFNDLKKGNEGTQAALDETNDVLEKTEIVLKNTRFQLEQEETLRKAHQETEGELYGIGTELLSALDQTVEHMNGLHAKLHRKSDLHELNRQTWQAAISEVIDVTKIVDDKVGAFQSQHSILLADLSTKIKRFVEVELGHVQSGKSELREFTYTLDQSESHAKEQSSKAHNEMNDVLEEIKMVREDIKAKVGEGLNGLSAAAARISNEVISELSEFHAQVSYYEHLRILLVTAVAPFLV
jgi:kinesin family protein 11